MPASFRFAPAIWVFGLFSGSTATGRRKLLPDSSAIPFYAMQDDKAVNSLDMSSTDNYADMHVTNHPVNSLVQGDGMIFSGDAIPGKISP
jgi:hypothetical protein